MATPLMKLNTYTWAAPKGCQRWLPLPEFHQFRWEPVWPEIASGTKTTTQLRRNLISYKGLQVANQVITFIGHKSITSQSCAIQLCFNGHGQGQSFK